jgi:hypothetical protein
MTQKNKSFIVLVVFASSHRLHPGARSRRALFSGRVPAAFICESFRVFGDDRFFSSSALGGLLEGVSS